MRIVRGRTTVIQSQIFIDNGMTPASLVGAAVRCIVKKNKRDADADALLVKQIGSGIVVVDEATGKVEITFSASEINISLAYNKVFFEVTAKLAGGYFIGHGSEELEIVDNIQNIIY